MYGEIYRLKWLKAPLCLSAILVISALISLLEDSVAWKRVYANIPAAYLACEGAPEGAECALPGPQFGVCTRDTLCEDIPETVVDECVLCVDGCWAGQDGDSCIRPWSGVDGVCETQDRCTDPVETSFEECRRCVEIGEVTSHGPSTTERDLSGCALRWSSNLQSQSPLGVSALIVFWLSALLSAYIFRKYVLTAYPQPKSLRQRDTKEMPKR